jgi:hypothetical protein
MMPAGYMAKRVLKKPDWLRAAQVADIYSISGCMSATFADYIDYWKHNGFWFFDSPALIRSIAHAESVDLGATSLFYYEAYEKEFDGEYWHAYAPDPAVLTEVVVPSKRKLEGFDVVTFSCGSSPECSPLSCNGLAEQILTNSHCLLASLEDAEIKVNERAFNDSEPGPYRLFSVYSVEWP